MKSLDLVTTEELAAMCGVAPNTCRYWRHVHQGPKFFKVGGKRVFYKRADVEEWIEDQYRAANPETSVTRARSA
jgi:predicted DNA-binding transcriptional regulator AlpA